MRIYLLSVNLRADSAMRCLLYLYVDIKLTKRNPNINKLSWAINYLRADSAMRCSRENARPVSWWAGWGKPDHCCCIIVIFTTIIILTIIPLHTLKEGSTL